MVSKRKAGNSLETTPKKVARAIVFKVEVRSKPRKKKSSSWEPYSDLYFVGLPEDNARSMAVLSNRTLGWKQVNGNWQLEEPTNAQFHLRSTKIEVLQCSG